MKFQVNAFQINEKARAVKLASSRIYMQLQTKAIRSLHLSAHLFIST